MSDGNGRGDGDGDGNGNSDGNGRKKHYILEKDKGTLTAVKSKRNRNIETITLKEEWGELLCLRKEVDVLCFVDEERKQTIWCYRCSGYRASCRWYGTEDR